MKSRRIKQPAKKPPYYRAERLAAELNIALGTFYRWAKKYGFTKHRFGNGRGFVWYRWDEVFLRLSKARVKNLPDLDFGS